MHDDIRGIKETRCEKHRREKKDTERQTGGGSETYRQRDRETDRQTETERYRETEIYIETERRTERQAERRRQIQREKKNYQKVVSRINTQQIFQGSGRKKQRMWRH